MIKHVDPSSQSGFRFELTQEEHDAGLAAFLTGPISGTVAIPSGAAYDVTEDAIAVRVEHIAELRTTIHKMHHAAGRFLNSPLPSDSPIVDSSLSTPTPPTPPPTEG